TAAVASCWSCRTADLSVPTPFFFTSSTVGRDLTAFSTLLTGEQYAGLLLLPQPASSPPPIRSAGSARTTKCRRRLGASASRTRRSRDPVLIAVLPIAGRLRSRPSRPGPGLASPKGGDR